MPISIYILQNTVNNKIYVGQTNDVSNRERQHRQSKKKTPLYCSIGKYGFSSFKMTVIEEFESRYEADEAEIFWIDFFQSRNLELGYNLAEGGGVNRGNKWTSKMRENHSKIKKEYYKNNPEAANRMRNIALGKSPSNARFDSNQISQIREDFLSCKFTFVILAAKYSCDNKTIMDICRNVIYKDINYIIPPSVDEHYQSIKGQRKLTSVLTQIIKNDRIKGLSVRQIAKNNKVSLFLVRKAIKS